MIFSLWSNNAAYGVEIKMFDERSKPAKNVLQYNIDITRKKTQYSSFVLHIVKSNINYNNTKDFTPYIEMLFIAARPLNDLLLTIKEDGRISKINNYKEVKKLWADMKFKIENTYQGDIVQPFIAPIDKAYSDEEALIASFSKDPFLFNYFGVVFGNKNKNAILGFYPQAISVEQITNEKIEKKQGANIDVIFKPETTSVEALQKYVGAQRNDAVLKFIDYAVSDDGDTVRPQIYQLKNNYQLLIRPVVCEGDNMYHICLKNGENDSTVLEFDNPYINNSKYGPRYENVDFDNYFAITSFEGGYYVNLYEKKTGKRVLLAYEGMYDTEKQMLIYVTDDIENTSTILYDLNRNKKINLDDKINKNEEFGQVDYQRYFTIYKTTKDYIYIRYDASEKSYKFKVKR